MVFKQKALGAITAPGAEKNYKYIYIKHLLDRIAKVYDLLPSELSATKIVAYRDEVIGYVEDDAEKNKMIKDADALALRLESQLKDETGESLDSKQQIEAKRIAAIRAVGWVFKYFDTAWNWSRKRGILIAGPFGDGRRRFLPLSLLPLDGRYLLVLDDYTPKEGEVVFDLKLRALLLNNMGEDRYDDARSDREEEPSEEAPANVNGNGSDGSQIST